MVRIWLAPAGSQVFKTRDLGERRAVRLSYQCSVSELSDGRSAVPPSEWRKSERRNGPKAGLLAAGVKRSAASAAETERA
jgi:hypothetical protein